MANTIQHKRSSTATTVPTAGQLSAGELAVNTADGKLYLKKDNAAIVQIGGPAAAGDLTGATLASGVTASSLTSVGALTSLTVNNTGVKVGEHISKFLTITSDGTNNAITQNGNSTLSINHSNNGSIYIGDSDGNNNSTYIDVNDDAATIILHGEVSGTSTTASTSSTTGALIVAGGVGIAKDSYINGHRIGQGLLVSQTNLAVGTSTLNSTIAGGTDNTAVGYLAGSNITTGTNNVMLGSNAGHSNTTGIGNLCIGTGSHYKNTTGSYTVAIGDGAGHEINSASVYNAFIGTYSGYYLTSGSNLVCIGGQAGFYQADGVTALTASSNSVYIGYNAKGFNNSDSNSIVIGSGAIGIGANSTVIGTSSTTAATIHGALSLPSTTASTSSATGALIVSGGVGIAKDSHINSQRIGVGLLQDTTNLAVGANALVATIAGGIRNTAIGSGCGSNITSGTQNTLLGYAVGTNVTTGAGNCSIGYVSLNQNTVGNYNTAVGYGALEKTTSSNNTAVGISALGNITTGSLNTAVGREAGCFQADGTTALTTANNSVYLGRDTRGTQTDSNSVVIGYQAIGLGANTTVIGTSSTTAATIHGALSLPSTTASTSSATGALIVSGGVGIAKDSHINSQRIGVGLLQDTTNLAVGANALVATIAGGIRNTAIGSGCGSNITSGTQNTLLGYAVGTNVTTGAGNCSIGYVSLNQNTVGNYNTAVGYGALEKTTSSNNTAVGISALGNITTGSLNTAVGREAGCFQADGTTALTTANNSVYLGRDTRGTQTDSNSVVIGYQAIGLGANTTVIGTSSTTAATIYGTLNLPSGLSAAGATFNGTVNIGTTALISAPSATALAIKSQIPAGTGVTPTIQVICPSSEYLLTNQIATQKVFNLPQDTITLQAATTYMFEGHYLLTTGTTSHTTSMSFVLTTATITNCTWTTFTTMPSALNTTTSGNATAIFNSVTGGVVNGASVNPNTMITFKGIMRVNAGGTMVPNIAFSAQPGGTNNVLIGSYLKFYPIGSNTIDFVGTAIG